jgi:hypothetical protein
MKIEIVGVPVQGNIGDESGTVQIRAINSPMPELLAGEMVCTVAPKPSEARRLFGAPKVRVTIEALLD